MKSLALATSLAAAAAARLSETVDTRIGAGGVGYGAGSINPGAQVPFGAMRLGPDTTWMDPTWGNWWLGFQHFGGYAYIDNSITAFSHTHMVGPGINDLGDFGVMVTRQLTESTIEDSAENARYASVFSHDNETAVAGYYATYLQNASTYAELTVSGTHSGIHRYTCEDAPSGRPNECIVLLDLAHTAIAPPAVPFGSITVSRLPTSPGTAVLQATVLQKGGLSERGPLGGIYVYFYAEVSAVSLNGSGLALPRLGVWANNTLLSPAVLNATSTSNNIGGFVDFGAGPLAITVRTGISFISEDAAKANLYAQQTSAAAQLQAGQAPQPRQRKLRNHSEPRSGKAPKRPHAIAAAGPAYTAPAWLSFEEVRAQAQAQWDEMLGRVAVTLPPDLAPGDAAGNLTSFYSAVYRSFLAPTTYSEADGRYLGMDGNVHSVLASPLPLASYHSDMSIWDIHRSQTPWLLLAAPETAVAVANSLLTMAAQGGKLPRWPLANVYTGCMDGSHAVIILGDMLSKGLPGLNTSAIYAATLAALTAQEDPSYLSLGYVSSEQSSTAASSTLEYAYDDAIAAVIARIAGEDAQADAWATRAQGYRKIWNSTVSLPCPRSASGEFACPAIPELPYPIDSGYVEGDALQYQTFVPHDQVRV
jgi:putative alpha-1,2-mannosidase